MPVNKDGDGPEMNPGEVVEVLHQVWDTDFRLIMSFNTEEQARASADRLNQDGY